MNLDCPVKASPSASTVSVISGPLRVNTIRNHSTSGMDISSTGMSFFFLLSLGFMILNFNIYFSRQIRRSTDSFFFGS
jgi:hypothetical protein